MAGRRSRPRRAPPAPAGRTRSGAGRGSRCARGTAARSRGRPAARRSRWLARRRGGRPRRPAGAAPGTRARGARCRGRSGAGTWPPAPSAGRCGGACGTQYGSRCGRLGKSRSKWVVSRAERAARQSTMRSRSALAGGRRRGCGSAGARRGRAGRTTPRDRGRPARPPSPSPASKRASAARRSASTTSASRTRVFAAASRTLNAETSTPTDGQPYVEHSTSVVPLPANGSRMRWPGVKWRSRKASTSCGTYLPRYGCSRCTCFVRRCSGRSRSLHDSSGSTPAASAARWIDSCVATGRERSGRGGWTRRREVQLHVHGASREAPRSPSWPACRRPTPGRRSARRARAAPAAGSPPGAGGRRPCSPPPYGT